MPKPGRLYIPVDVGFWDGDGDGLSWEAQNLFLMMCARSKVIGSSGHLTLSQVAKVGAPKDCGRLIDELLKHRKPTDGEPLVIPVTGGVFIPSHDAWNGGDNSVEARANEGNHTRWHVNRGISDPECALCSSSLDDPGINAGIDPNGIARPDQTRPKRPDSDSEDRSIGWEKFWTTYPPRNGRKVGKDKASERWCKLSLTDKRAAYRGATNLRADVDAGRTLAPDAFRWLRDRSWNDYQASVDAANGATTSERSGLAYDPDAPSIFQGVAQ